MSTAPITRTTISRVRVGQWVRCFGETSFERVASIEDHRTFVVLRNAETFPINQGGRATRVDVADADPIAAS